LQKKKLVTSLVSVAICTSTIMPYPVKGASIAVPDIQQMAYAAQNSNSTYTVQKGDSLWIISRKFGTSIESLMTINSLKSDNIKPGQVLKISAASVSSNSVTEVINLTIGSKGAQVSQVQKYLIALGFYTGTANGEYDLETARGTVRFQRSKNIYAHGRIDKNTYNALVKEYTNKTSAGNADTSTSDVNLTIGSTGATVTRVQNYLNQLGHVMEVDGNYTLETARGIVGFQRSKGIYAHGRVDSNTYNALVKAVEEKTRTVSRGSASMSGAVAYDWFEKVNKELFPIGSTAKVTDVQTRKTFYIKRSYGYNHADCEALTLNDANVIKGIWGGFSWDTRAVVIEVNGYRIAASMASLPHAGLDKYPEGQTVDGRSGEYGRGTNLDVIKGNGMDGHFDVHFLNSRRHKDNAVDARHQEKIRQAVGK
jgi:peptidoglycan hydrolase-like protein with peptidoglycan-binding domain